MKNTRCKFRCDSVTLFANDEKSVELNAVTGGPSEENKSFWKSKIVSLSSYYMSLILQVCGFDLFLLSPFIFFFACLLSIKIKGGGKQ